MFFVVEKFHKREICFEIVCPCWEGSKEELSRCNLEFGYSDRNLVWCACINTRVGTSQSTTKRLQENHRAMSQAQLNKTLVQKALFEMFTAKNSDAIDTYLGSNYIQHDSFMPNGPEPVRALVQKLATKTDFQYENFRILANENFAVAHGRYTGWLPAPQVVFDIFRIENGKLVEHWSGLQDEIVETKSKRSMLDGPTEPIGDEETSKQSAALVHQFLDQVLIHHKMDTLANYFDGDTYYQHNPHVADGLSGLGAALQAWAQQGIHMVYTKIHKLVADGNLVFSHCEGTFAGKPYAFCDLFRVEKGKILEHWDVMQPIPTEYKHQNGFF